MIPRKKQWKSWSLPSKLTAIGPLIGILSFGIFLFEKSFDIKETLKIWLIKDKLPQVPEILVKVKNSGQTDISIFSRGEFIIWFPQGVYNGVQTVPGKYKLTPIENNVKQNGLIKIKSGEEVSMYAALMN